MNYLYHKIPLYLFHQSEHLHKPIPHVVEHIFNINEYQYQSQQIVCLNSSIEQSENKHELEKANLMNSKKKN